MVLACVISMLNFAAVDEQTENANAENDNNTLTTATKKASNELEIAHISFRRLRDPVTNHSSQQLHQHLAASRNFIIAAV